MKNKKREQKGKTKINKINKFNKFIKFIKLNKCWLLGKMEKRK